MLRLSAAAVPISVTCVGRRPLSRVRQKKWRSPAVRYTPSATSTWGNTSSPMQKGGEVDGVLLFSAPAPAAVGLVFIVSSFTKV